MGTAKYLVLEATTTLVREWRIAADCLEKEAAHGDHTADELAEEAALWVRRLADLHRRSERIFDHVIEAS